MRKIWLRLKAHFQTRKQKFGGILVLASLWQSVRPMIDELRRIDFVWQIGKYVPIWRIAEIVSALAVACASFFLTPAGTLAIVLMGFALIFFGGADEGAITQKMAVTRTAEVDEFLLSRAVHVGRIEAWFERLLEEGVIVMMIDAFTGAMNPISIDSAIEGTIRLLLGEPDKAPEMDLLLAIAPQIDSTVSRLDHIPRFASFQIFLKQPISGTVANDIWVGLCNGKHLRFEFESLTIRASEDTPGSRKQRFPLWDGVICRRVKSGEIVYSRLVKLVGMSDVLHPEIKG
jgi:hypothetical protein